MEEKKNIPIFGASLTGILCYNELIKKNINVIPKTPIRE